MRLAWLTPDIASLSAPVQCREIVIPGDLWAYITGALWPLTIASNWEQYGTATPDESAAFFQEAIGQYLISMCAHIGEIRPFAFAPVPDRWLALDGASVDADDYPLLADVVPASWLGGGNINLPDMTARGLVGHGGGYDLGDVGGEETHDLTIAEMPAHTHDYEIAVLTADIAGEIPAPALDALAPAVTGNTGGGDSHNNMPPYLVIVWGIYAGE